MKRYLLTLLTIPLLAFSNANAQSNCQAEFILVDQCPYFEFIDTSSATSNIVDWYYDFGDGGSSNSQNPVYTFNSDGTFLVCLYITTSDSCTSMFCDSVVVDCLGQSNCIDPNIIDSNVFCNQVIDPVCGCDSITYDNSCIAENYYGITSWTPGACGIQSSCSASFVVDDSVSLCPSFQFMDLSTGSNQVIEWSYDFGDGATSTSQNPNHVYQTNGIYTVCLFITTADSCTSTFCDQVTVDCIGQQSNCQAEFMVVDDSVTQCPTFQFMDLSTGSNQVIEWSYDFGDGATSTSQNPNHVYQTNGIYTVCMSITTSDSCTSWFCDQVTVDCLGQQSNCQAEFIVVDDSVSQCPTFQFYDMSTSTFTIGEWYYDFGDGTSSQSKNPSHTFLSNGTYTVCLYTTSADSCTSSYCETITVNCLAGIIDLNEFEMNVSPNPASNSLSLNLGQTMGINYRIFGLNGQVYDSGERMSEVQHKFDISTLSKGMYLLEVIVDDHREIIRFIKE